MRYSKFRMSLLLKPIRALPQDLFRQTEKRNCRISIGTSTMDPGAYMDQRLRSSSNHISSWKGVVRNRVPDYEASVGSGPKWSKTKFILPKHVPFGGEMHENWIATLKEHRIRLSSSGRSLATNLTQQNCGKMIILPFMQWAKSLVWWRLW